MNEWLEVLIALTVAGSTIVACMLLLNPVSVDAFPAKWRYLVGKLAVVFYFLPIPFVVQCLSFSSPEPIYTLHSTQPIYGDKINPEQYISFEIATLILVIWGLGTFFFATWHIYCYCKFNREIKRTSIVVPQDSKVAKMLYSCKQSLEIRTKVKLAYNSDITSPALVGLLKPMILLPVEIAPDAELSMVLHHELIHLKRKDLWVKILVLGVSAIHWFNPLVHILRKDIHIWSELSCDAEVVTEMSHMERKRYGQTILNMLADTSEIPTEFCASLSETKKDIERRLTMLLNVKKQKKHIIAITVTAVIAIGAVGITTAAWAAKNTPSIGEDTALKEATKATNDHESVKKLQLNSEYELISVKRSDERKFKPEDWKDILSKIKSGEIIWEDE
ncbi:M56 family metallopeptidase [Paenibacillus alvei]|uniref:M56 family metallopeptidase n=1 Tax=Paenibacillus alvei TaxID=44250 RepID=A0ABT4H3F9_PAEAL|nr:M56 family metallopeptidase [Paenibacillus alvei]MCY9763510.1 M56 family metallopeptidase [Paenibacillus alvei]MCY9767478.1 M56 family metallopeptidase [Paenibacillus alvei]